MEVARVNTRVQRRRGMKPEVGWTVLVHGSRVHEQGLLVRLMRVELRWESIAALENNSLMQRVLRRCTVIRRQLTLVLTVVIVVLRVLGNRGALVSERVSEEATRVIYS